MNAQRKSGLWVLLWAALLCTLLGAPALAQSFPPLTGRVVDAAHILSADQVAALDAKIQTGEKLSGHQFVVATIPNLEGRDIADYGYRLGRAWALGAKDKNDGIILLVAPTEHKVRIEVGYGLEPYMTDAFSSVIINSQIIPKFKSGDWYGGIDAGSTTILDQIRLTPEQAQARMAKAADNQRQAQGHIDPATIIWMLMFFFFFILPLIRRMTGGRRYGGMGPVIMWGPSIGGGGGSSWGGGDFGGGGGGGFSGGGGSFGGGGSSGSW